MKQVVLKSNYRDVENSSPKKLRSEGWVPGVIYGKGLDSVPVQVPKQTLLNFVKEGHQVFEINVEGKGQYLVNLDNIEKDNLGKNWHHVSFHQLKKGVENHVTVPVVITGKAVGAKTGGVIQQQMNEVHLLATPENIPESFVIDVTELDSHQQWSLKDLTPPKGTKFRTTDLEHAVVSCSVPKMKIVEETTPVETDAEATPEVQPEGTEEKKAA
ncbi:MAG: 50S ribosomal protein L25 [Bacteriovoracaceae bacterium]